MNTFVPPPGFQEFLTRTPTRRDKQLQRALRQGRGPAHLGRRAEPFRSFHQRRDDTVRQGSFIRSDGHGGGLFQAYAVLPGSADADEYGVTALNQIHVSFLSGTPGVPFYFEAFLKTAARVAADAIVRQAEDAIEARMTPEDREATKFRVFIGPPEKRGGSLPLLSAPPAGAPSLGGLTPAGAKAAWLRKRWDQRLALAPVAESAAVSCTRGAARTVDLVVADANLTVAGVMRAIERFRERGERSFADLPLRADVLLPALDPLLRERLWWWDRDQAELEGRELPFPDDPQMREAAQAQHGAMRLA